MPAPLPHDPEAIVESARSVLSGRGLADDLTAFAIGECRAVARHIDDLVAAVCVLTRTEDVDDLPRHVLAPVCFLRGAADQPWLDPGMVIVREWPAAAFHRADVTWPGWGRVIRIATGSVAPGPHLEHDHSCVASEVERPTEGWAYVAGVVAAGISAVRGETALAESAGHVHPVTGAFVVAVWAPWGEHLSLSW